MASTSHAGGAGFRRDRGHVLDVRRATFDAGIADWIRERRAGDKPACKTIQGLGGFDRAAALRHATVDALCHYYRTHPNADVAPALIALVAALSDNDEHGACYMAVPRLAALFNRSPRRVSDALGRLSRTGIVPVGRQPGRTSVYAVGIAPPIAADPTAPVVWTVDAYAPRPPTLPSGVTLASGVTLVSPTPDVGVHQPPTPTSPNITSTSQNYTPPGGAPKPAPPHRPALTLRTGESCFDQWMSHLRGSGATARADEAERHGVIVVDRRWPP